MDDFEKLGPMLDYDLSPESLEQLDAIYQGIAKYCFATKEDFERVFMRIHPDELSTGIGVWQDIADAFLLYRNRYADGHELEDSKAKLILSALSGLDSISPTDAADDIDEALYDFDALPEETRRQVLSCLLKVSEERKGGKKNENPAFPSELADRIWVDHHLAIIESLRSPGGRDSDRRKKRTKRASRK